MSRERRQPATIVVDGTEIEAPEGTMLVDAAKRGDVEIPVFCYEPKLGHPVGACRMCLVEIEGIPKLQTACSTPIRDGMVVYTTTDRVKEAQNAVVEFLLVNHPLDCPVCDKGGECPLQDIAMGWGPGKSRVTDPKRHFQKPIPLSPLVKIDRERCILCYRCVRFSQEVSEDEQLQLLERGPNTFVGTFDDRPYVAPFHGNIIELCPVGALTSQSYRFRARPWDVEDAGSVCTLCPSQCNVKFTVRDEQVARVLGRDNPAVDDGWICDKGRFGYEMFAAEDRPTAPRIRAGGALEEAGWEQALEATVRGLAAARGKVAAIVGGGASNEEAYLLQRMLRGPLGSTDVAGTAPRALPVATRRALSDPALAPATAEIDHADAILVVGTDPMQEMPILELRIRKAVRRHGAKLLVATERPTALDGGAAVDSAGCLEAERIPPGGAAVFLEGLASALTEDEGDGFAAALREADDVVIVWGEGLAGGAGGERAAAALLEIAANLGLGERPGSGLYEVPAAANGRGIREAGACENTGPGLVETTAGRSAEEIREALEAGELEALILWDVDPIRDFDDPEGWRRAIAAAGFTLASSLFGSESADAADVHLPAETHAEKEGTVTHPDGRLQRVRPSVPRPDRVRPLWQALVELSAELGDETGAGTAQELFELLERDSPLYAGMTYDTIGGSGQRWQEVDPSQWQAQRAGGEGPADTQAAGAEATAAPETAPRRRTSGGPPPPAPSNGSFRLGTYRDLWADYVAERNPSLVFLSPGQTLEMSAGAARSLGVGNGAEVVVKGDNGTELRAQVAIRERTPNDTVFVIEGTREQGANRLSGASTVIVSEAPPEPDSGPEFGTSEREKVGW